jgi:fumarylacetoacetate (FAA) hydrolase
MKLATLNDGSRDGQLVVVSRDLATAHYATGIASRLQQALDDWNFLAPQLQDLYDTLNFGKARHAFAFDPANCLAPLPRGPLWVSALPGDHGAPLWHQAGGDHFAGPRATLPAFHPADEVDFSAELAAITGDVPRASPATQALEGVRLLVLANAVCLRGPLASGDVLSARPFTAFSPVAVTPDELGDAWRGGRMHLNLLVHRNDRRVAQVDMSGAPLGFGELLAQACRQRPLRAGSALSTGPVGLGSAAAKRAQEQAEDGQPTTALWQPGEAVRIEAKGTDGLSIFGTMTTLQTPFNGD